MLARLKDHPELLLTLAGLLLLSCAIALLGWAGYDPVLAAGLTAPIAAAGVGLSCWLARRKQRRVREAAIYDVQAMLKDVINNQLAVIMGTLGFRSGSGSDVRRAQNLTTQSVEKISNALNDLSEDSLRRWQSRYRTSGQLEVRPRRDCAGGRSSR